MAARMGSAKELIHVLDCPYCQFRSLRLNVLQAHISSNHPSQPKRLIIFSCPLCFAKSTDMQLLEDHKILYHDQQGPLHPLLTLLTTPKSMENNEHSSVQNNIQNRVKRKSVDELLANTKSKKVKPSAWTNKEASSSTEGSTSEEICTFSPRKTRRQSSNDTTVPITVPKPPPAKSIKPTVIVKKPETKEKPKNIKPANTKEKLLLQPVVYKRMKELWRMGTHNPHYLRNFLRTFVERDLIIDAPVRKTDTTYFPTLGTIKQCLSQWPHDFPKPSISQASPTKAVRSAVPLSNTTQITLSNRRGVVNTGGSASLYHHSHRVLLSTITATNKASSLFKKKHKSHRAKRLKDVLARINAPKTPRRHESVEAAPVIQPLSPSVTATEVVEVKPCNTLEFSTLVDIDLTVNSLPKETPTFKVEAVGVSPPIVDSPLPLQVLWEEDPSVKRETDQLQPVISNIRSVDIDSPTKIPTEQSSELLENDGIKKEFNFHPTTSTVMPSFVVKTTKSTSDVSSIIAPLPNSTSGSIILNSEFVVSPPTSNTIAPTNDIPRIVLTDIGKPMTLSLPPYEQAPQEAAEPSPVESSGSCICPLCFGEFSDSQELKVHRIEVHPLNI